MTLIHCLDRLVIGESMMLTEERRVTAQLSIGCVRSRFAKHIAILILVDAAASALGYFLTGYAFAFGDNTDDAGVANGNYFIGECRAQAACTA